MGFMDSLKENAKKGANALGSGVKNLATTAANEIKKRQAYSNAQRRVLNKFEMKQLKAICKVYGIGEPSPYEEDFDGSRHRITLTSKHYINYAMNHLSLEQMKDFAGKNRIYVSEIINDYQREINNIQGTQTASTREVINVATVPEERPSPTKEESFITATSEVKSIDDEFSTILNEICENFRPEPLRDEKELENQLSQWLKAKYGNNVIQRQVPTQHGKIDIVLHGKYALELKIADNKNVLRDLWGQLRDYKKAYPNLAAVLLDGHVRSIDRSGIEYYQKEYKNDGINSIIIDGALRKKLGRGGTTVIVK